jgi:PAS domain S-box-containing protein
MEKEPTYEELKNTVQEQSENFNRLNLTLNTLATEMRESKIELAHEKYRLSVILEGTNAGTWEWNIKTGETFFNERWAEIIGYTLKEMSPVSIDTWIRFTHPDDLKLSHELLEKHFKGELDYYEYEARMKHKEGHWVWILDKGRVHKWNEVGEPLLMSGTHQNITERKLAENELRKSNDVIHLNQVLQKRDKEKSILLKEIHHRVKNNLQIITSLLRLQSSSIKDIKVKELFKSSQYRINAMSTIHEMLYQSDNLDNIDYSKYLKVLLGNLLLTMKGAESDIKIHIEADDVILNIDTSIPLGLMINEIMTNSLKYGLTNNNQGEINVEIKESNKGNYEMLIGDNGVGIPEDIPINNTNYLGLQLIKQLTMQLKGSIEIDNSKNGTNYIVTFQEINQDLL